MITARRSFHVAAVAVLGVAFCYGVADAKPKKRAKAEDAAAATQPAAEAPATAPQQQQGGAGTPAAIVGKWMYGSVSPTTYWDADTGAFAGNARGSAGIYEFDDAGRYKEYIYLELRTGNYTNKAWTVHEGTVEFGRDTFTIHPGRGHYQFWTNGKQTTDRDMTPEEAKGLTKTYRWTLTKDEDGSEVFTVPFEDGSKMDYRRQRTE